MSLVKLQIENKDLNQEVDYGFLNADTASGSSTLSLLSINSFAVNQILLIGEIGSEKTEIIKTHASTAPSGNTVTLASNTVYAHSQGTKVYIIQYDQYELSHATSSTGSKTTLTTTLGNGLIPINPETLETYYYDTEYSTGGYFIRKKNSIDGTFSDYSDYVPYAGFGDNTVASVKERALRQLGKEIGGLITNDFLNESLWQARRELDSERKRWSFRTSFNTDIGNVVTGAYSIDVPTTLRNPDSPQNILGLRIGDNGQNLKYVSKRTFDVWYEGTGHTTVNTQPSIGDTSIILNDTRDFDESGTITIASNNITYTANNESTGTLSGIPSSGDGSIDTAHAVDIDVWQDKGFGLPTEYTIFEDKIYFNVPFDSTYVDQNIWMDYYRTLPVYDSDADTFDEPQYDLFVSYLKYRIKDLEKRGTLKITQDSDYLEWLQGKEKIKRIEFLNQDVQFIPNNSHLDMNDE